MKIPEFSAEAALCHEMPNHYHEVDGGFRATSEDLGVLPQACVNECTSFFDDFTFGGPLHRECERFCTTDPQVSCGPCKNGRQRCVVPHYGASYVPC